MRIYLPMEKKVKVLAKVETPYEVNGNKGITYRIAFLLDNDVEKVKCSNKDVWDSFKVGDEYLLTGELDIRGGSAGEWKVNGFRPIK